jgi:hypothetical protein
MNKNLINESGDRLCYYLLGQSSEFLKAGNLFDYLEELKQSKLVPEYEKAVKNVATWQTKRFRSVFDFGYFRLFLYTIIRDFRPRLILESGVLHGMTSGFLLEAIAKNRQGQLISVDLPSVFGEPTANKDGYSGSLPEGKQSGWLVPERLKKYWHLKLGSSSDVLPKLNLKQPLDLFIHDSDHTYETMWFELNYGWAALAPGGILICDNIEANASFHNFCKKHRKLPLVLPVPNKDATLRPRFGLIAKT